MKSSSKYTIYVPGALDEKLREAYDTLTMIDSNFSKLLQCILYSMIKTAKFIVSQKKNFRHYNWHLIIHDKKTGQYFSTCNVKKIISKLET